MDAKTSILPIDKIDLMDAEHTDLYLKVFRL